MKKEQEDNLERIQKSALKIILQERYKTYENACDLLNISDLKTRRQYLFEKFTRKNINHPLFKHHFKEIKQSSYYLRKMKKYEETKARTERQKKSTIPQMQCLANQMNNEQNFNK